MGYSKLVTKIKRLIGNPWSIYSYGSAHGAFHWVPDNLHCSILYRSAIGHWPDLESPSTFNEKLQWLKLYDHNPLYTKLVDKLAVKEWVAARIGSEYVTQTYARWDCAEDIDIAGLPDKFVLKTNHDCGGIAICGDRSSFDLGSAKIKLASHLRRNYYWGGREWPYKDVKRCVFAEEYIEPNSDGDLPDSKLFRFSNGRIITLLVTDRLTEAGLTKTFFDEEWRPLELAEGGHPRRPDAQIPERFDEMKTLAAELAGEFPFARVDFYESNGGLLFGEMTFYPNSGFERFDPDEWDATFGSWIELPGGGWLNVTPDSLLYLHHATDRSLTFPGGLTDYKVFCFGGRADCMMVCLGRETGHPSFYFVDRDWNLKRYNASSLGIPEGFTVPRPENVGLMFSLAEELSQGIPFVRADFYDTGDRVLFGEMTFYPQSGFDSNILPDADLRWGRMLDIDGLMERLSEGGPK